MANFSVRTYLEEKYGSKTSGRGKIICPFCQHQTMDITKDNQLAKCFHLSCGRYINAHSIQSNTEHFQQLLWDVMQTCHQALNIDKAQSAYRYLTEERNVHPQIIMESPVLGMVPFNLDFEALYMPHRERLQQDVPSKELEETLQQFDQDTEKLRQLLDKSKGYLVFGYTNKTHRLKSFKFRQPYSKKLTVYKPFSSSGVFNLQLFDANENALVPYLLLTEGEFNILSLQSLLLRLGLSYCRALALGSCTSVDWYTLKQFKERWVLFQDTDCAGDTMAMEMQTYRTYKLAKSSHQDDDLDSFIQRFDTDEKALEEVKQLIQKAVFRFRLTNAIADEINTIRRREKQKMLAFEVNQQVGTVMRDELDDRGQFFRTPVAPYFLDLETSRLYLINKALKDTQRYLHRYSLNPTESIHNFVLSELERQAYEHGQPTQVYQYCHYNQSTNRLYLFNRDTEVYRVSIDTIDIVSNGTDGILFEALPGYQPFTRQDVDSNTDLLVELYTSRVYLDEGALTTEEYRLLLGIWVYHLFFDGLHATHPICAFIGPKGSSKTSSVRRLGILLFGASFQVSPIPEKPDDFDAAVTNGFLVGFDNVDGQTQWLNDKLAIVATGGCIKRRELYSTNNLIEYPIRACVAITSRTPKFRRDDVAERLLPFPLKTLPQKVSEQHLLDEALAERNRFMSWMLLRLQEILCMLAKTADQATIHTDLRMADFATFMLRIAEADGVVEPMLDIIQRLANAQSQFTLEQDPLFELLNIIADQFPGKAFTTAQLHQELMQLAARNAISYKYKSANSLGQKIGHIKGNLEQFLHVDIDYGTGNVKYYRFSPKLSEGF